jgi:hypothetical protein
VLSLGIIGELVLNTGDHLPHDLVCPTEEPIESE